MDEWMGSWMSEWMSEWVSEWVDGFMDEWVSEWVSACMNGWMDGWIVGRMDEWMNEWMNCASLMEGCMAIMTGTGEIAATKYGVADLLVCCNVLQDPNKMGTQHHNVLKHLPNVETHFLLSPGVSGFKFSL
jgi:hypothetical protein